MNQFNFNRFWQTQRWVLSVNRRRLLMWSAGSAAGVFLFEILLMRLNGDGGSKSELTGMSQFLTFMIVMASIVGLCSITSGIERKPDRAAMLMLPASSAEKFLSLLVYVSIVWPMCICLAYMTGDALRIGVTALMGQTTGSTIPLVLDNLNPLSGLGLWQETAFALALCLCMHSWYVFFGTTFRRYAFVVSNLGALLIVTALVTGMVHYGIQHFGLFRQSWENGVMIDRYINPLVYPLTAMLLALAALNYWRSYRIFSDMQLISNKWTNANIPNHWKPYDILSR